MKQEKVGQEETNGKNKAIEEENPSGARDLALRILGLVAGFVVAGLLAGLGIGYLTQSCVVFPFGAPRVDPLSVLLLLSLALSAGLAAYAFVGWWTEARRSALRSERFAEIKELIDQERKSFEALSAVWKEKEKKWTQEERKWQQRYKAWCKLRDSWRVQAEEFSRKIAELKEANRFKSSQKQPDPETAEKIRLAEALKTKVEELEAALSEKAACDQALKEEARKWQSEAEKLKQEAQDHRKELENLKAELEDLKERLEHASKEKEELAEKLAQKEKEEAESLLRTRSARDEFSFLSRLSAVLRSPIQRLAHLARAGNKPPEETLEEIAQCAERFLKTLDNILDIAKVQRGSLQLVLVEAPLERVVTRTLSRFRPMADERQITIRWPQQGDDLGKVKIDERILERCLECLLQNALQWTPRGGWVEVRARVEGEGPGRKAVLEVIDSGVGIPPEKQEEIFEPFVSKVTAAPNVGEEGSGIGLTLVRALTKAHNGTVSVTSTAGEGSRFTLELPEPQAAPSGEQEAPIVVEQAQPVK